MKGPADRLMGPLGIEVSCVGVASAYRDFCSALVIDAKDAHLAPDVEALGVRAVVADTLMRDAAGRCRARTRHPRRRRVTLTIIPIAGIGEVHPGDEIADDRRRRRRRTGDAARDRDCLVITQKIVSKAEGRLVAARPRRPRRHGVR